MASHGRLASGLQDSLAILLGNAPNLTVFDAFIDERNLPDVLTDYLNSLDDNDCLILCSDLYGGSINQQMALFLNRPNTYLVAGVNLAFLLKLAMQTEITKEELIVTIEKSRQALCLVELDKVAPEEEFF